ncbi:helix-turn-helix transcriptional regulator [Actinoplanes sp. M2I2]|uniref:helix-turn-helix transcriptional regulator n=1 Tax=Actinoplanes sp. M2I2 TaxID=1734444 RepID=UPI002021869F|nr:helix-turn-helix transcriptional regulator [Actinoplanes sp. M2I2]
MIRNEALADFLRDRRGRIEPGRLGLPHDRRRRVSGLRREEVAQHAGLSVDYYARLEQGRQRTASPGVLRSLARTLGLNDDERTHLFTLAHVAGEPAAPPAGNLGADRVRQLVTLLGDTPAMVVDPLLDVVHANAGAVFLFADFAAMPVDRRNAVRWMMLAPEARERYGPEWADGAADLVGMLRLHAGRQPDDPRLTELVAGLSPSSEDFRRLWQNQTVSTWRRPAKTLRHPGFGEMSFTNDIVAVQGAPELTLVIMAPAEPERFSAALAARM